MKRIPLFPAFSAYREKVRYLDGRRYLLRFRWMERSESWYFDIGLPGGDMLAVGRRVVLNYPLLPRDVHQDLPDGNLMAIRLDGSSAPIGREDLGNDVSLVYFGLDELPDEDESDFIREIRSV